MVHNILSLLDNLYLTELRPSSCSLSARHRNKIIILIALDTSFLTCKYQIYIFGFEITLKIM